MNLDVINFKAYQDLIASFCSCKLSKIDFSEDTPHSVEETMTKVLNTNQEVFKLLTQYDDLAFEDIQDVQGICEKATKLIVLRYLDFSIIRRQLLMASEALTYYRRCKLPTSLIGSYFLDVQENKLLLLEIDKVFLSSGEINIKCSPLLVQLDTQIKEQTKKIYRSCEEYQAKNSTKLMENLVFQRNERYCLLVKNAYRNSGGLILGESASQLAVYFEPNVIIHLNNLILKLKDDYQNEVDRILKALTSLVANNVDALNNNQNNFVMLDRYYAKARFMVKTKACNATITKERLLDVQGGCHFEIPEEVVVKNDYLLNVEKPVLLLSGPNTGGKSVSLKTIALSVIASYYGYPILAYQAIIGLFTQIFIDIGDSQSISDSLSSFSGHLKSLRQIIDNCDDHSLVIIDELGNGTDPNEGVAFAQAIVDDLLAKGSFCCITTHFNKLKQYAYLKTAIQIAAMEFDLERQQPTYKILKGHSGSSYGLLIAQKYHIPVNIIEKAKLYLSEQTSEVDLILENLNNELDIQNQKSQELVSVLNQQNELNLQLQDKLAKFENYRLQEMIKLTTENQEVISDIKKEANLLIQQYKTAKQDHLSIKLINDLANLHIVDEVVVEISELQVKDYVELLATHQIGYIVEIKGKNIIVDLNGVTLKTTRNKIKKCEYHSEKTIIKSNRKLKTTTLRLELNVIGLRVQEALVEVCNYLDSCLVNNYPTATIIHGIGTGALRKAIWRYLSTQSYVSEYRLGEIFEGSSGVTIVTLKGKSG